MQIITIATNLNKISTDLKQNTSISLELLKPNKIVAETSH